MLGLGILSWVLGQAIFTYYEWALGRPPPLPSIADVGYLSVYPFLLLGILLLPARPIPVASRTRIALDGLMIMTAAVTFSWYFILGPVMQQGTETTLAKAVSTAYPLADIVLIACLIILASRPEEHSPTRRTPLGARPDPHRGSRQQLRLLVAARRLCHGYAPRCRLVSGVHARSLGCLRRTAGPERGGDDDPRGADRYAGTASPPAEQRVWPSLLPYVLVPAVGILVVYAWRTLVGAAWRPGSISGERC